MMDPKNQLLMLQEPRLRQNTLCNGPERIAGKELLPRVLQQLNSEERHCDGDQSQVLNPCPQI